MAYVITCGDEGVQVNEGTRLGFAGSGFKLAGFSAAVKILKELLGEEEIRIATHSECDWIKEQLDLSNWEQVEASLITIMPPGRSDAFGPKDLRHALANAIRQFCLCHCLERST